MVDVALAVAAKVGGGVLSALKPFAPYIAVGVIGFGAAEGWEHRPHQGFPLMLLGQGLKAQLVAYKAGEPARLAAAQQAGANAQAASDKAAFGRWSDALKACEGKATDARDQSAQDLAAADKFANTQAAAAYRLGRASCGAPSHAPSPSSGPLPGGKPGGVRDPSDDLSALIGAGAGTSAP